MVSYRRTLLLTGWLLLASLAARLRWAHNHGRLA